MAALLRRIVMTAGMAALASGGVAVFCSRLENKQATPALNAVSHIAWGGPPPREMGTAGKNLIVGSLLHVGAAGFWATFFESLFGKAARRNPVAAWVGAATISGAAFITDYGIVSPRFRPGYEAYLSKGSLLGVYLALAAGFVLGARLTRERGSVDSKGL